MDKILKVLIEDARKTPAQIARLLGLPEATVTATIADYEQRGVILHYRTVIDDEKLGDPVCSALIEIKMRPERGVGFDSVAERVARFDEVKNVYLVSGDYDLVCLVEGKSMQEVAFFVADKLATIDRVEGTRTHFVLKRYKWDGAILNAGKADARLAVTP